MDGHVESLGTALGPIRVVTGPEGVREVHLGRRPMRGEHPTSEVAGELARYLSGEAMSFEDVAVDLRGFTDFERRVYDAARRIPYGETRTYGEIARAVGVPGAARAVGNALGKNPAAIVIPCHRVVASNGLGGFTGGLAWKRRLLRLEGSLQD